MGVDYKQLDDWTKKLKEAGKWEQARKAIVNDLSSRLIALAKQATPVDTGELKRNWAIGEITENNDYYEVEIINPTDYASYIEYGHRTRGGGGWVTGRFMMSKSEIKLASRTPQIIERKVAEFLEGIL